MTKRALVIMDSQNQPPIGDEFMNARNLMAEYCYTCSDALHAIKSNQYRCIVISMDMQKENPIEIIGALRDAENKSGLSPTQILVAGKTRQPTHAEMSKFNINAQIWSHYLK